MSTIKEVHIVNGAYIAEFDDGFIAEVCAFAQGEEAADRWCDEHHVIPNGMWLVNGWEAANEWLRGCGYEPDWELY